MESMNNHQNTSAKTMSKASEGKKDWSMSSRKTSRIQKGLHIYCNERLLLPVRLCPMPGHERDCGWSSMAGVKPLTIERYGRRETLNYRALWHV